MSLRKFAFLSVLSALATENIYAAEPADLFSRANCFNNESITYNYFDPPELRVVTSHHFENGVMKHYVTENPPVACSVGVGIIQTVDGLYCYYVATLDTRHAGVHGAFLSSEPNPDGTLIPGVTTKWSVTGYHTTIFPTGGYVSTNTSASDCNLHFEQFY
ncbi:hypothetical protein [Microbulbifer donghaiensis]|uniref:hypothetical protein n=1 Tax=Microbulbifer donghaiensis TaxID=494016 RepID=UPI0011610B23|nr:hypothetical protein [Microbulbifer donghaiensis]